MGGETFFPVNGVVGNSLNKIVTNSTQFFFPIEGSCDGFVFFGVF